MRDLVHIAAVLFCGGVVVGILSGRRLWIPLVIASALAMGIGVLAGNWSSYDTMFARWDTFLYGSLSIVGYFCSLFIGPAIGGAVLGLFIRGNFLKARRERSSVQ